MQNNFVLDYIIYLYACLRHILGLLTFSREANKFIIIIFFNSQRCNQLVHNFMRALLLA
jgi:hypothetical protein